MKWLDKGDYCVVEHGTIRFRPNHSVSLCAGDMVHVQVAGFVEGDYDILVREADVKYPLKKRKDRRLLLV